MPKLVVRKSYRCQPGKRREVLTALQKMEAAVAEAGYPRGRYVFVETRAPGEPDLEVEFTFEGYGELERLERAMRERVVRYLREGGATGQDALLEPSATKHLLLVEAPVSASQPVQIAPARAASATPARSVPTSTPAKPPDLTLEDDDDFEEPDEPETPPPPEVPAGMTPADFQRTQVERARAALQNAERTVGRVPDRPSKAE